MVSDALDPRLFRATIETDGGIEVFEDLSMYALGLKTRNEVLNEAQLQIFNLKKSTRDFLLTQTSPLSLDKRPKNLTIEVGRQSYGTFQLFTGSIIAGSPTQPPDIGITLHSLTGAALLHNMVSRSSPPMVKLSVLAAQIASDNGLTLNFQATRDPQISNYSFAGGSLKQVKFLNQVPGVQAFQDNNVLVVKDSNTPRAGKSRILSASTGMIGVPNINEYGGSVKMLIDNTVELGGELIIQSEINPAANGKFQIYQLEFDVSSRDTQFYYNAKFQRPLYNIGIPGNQPT